MRAPADDHLGLAVRSVDPCDTPLPDHEVHGVLCAIEIGAVNEHTLDGPSADVGVHRVEKRLRRWTRAFFHPKNP